MEDLTIPGIPAGMTLAEFTQLAPAVRLRLLDVRARGMGAHIELHRLMAQTRIDVRLAIAGLTDDQGGAR
ncbi:MAG TPA: hypothetical protein VHD87_13035 [Acidimicrobiales bacterium]|nr:hypothetical protein [Acidimicrobiales bacterium]